MRLPELLAPAGNLEKLRVALHYGADAVYLGGRDFGLRQLADNFTREELAEGVSVCHEQGARAYLTVNSYLHNDDLDRLPRFLAEVAAIPFDAYIVADPGVLALVREHAPGATLHLSTQANTVNWASARFWQGLGVGRINLARELSLHEIRTVVDRTPGMEFEVFLHGAMCISYSGRCLLSNVLSARDANRGACAHPCRWNYALVEETRPGEYFPIEEDSRGSFIFNSKDLCLLPHIPELVTSGVSALKIEGRMKGVHYVGSVVRVYREALDRYAADPDAWRCRPEWLAELGKVSHRGYTTGFLFGSPKDIDHEYHSRYIRSHDFVAIVEEAAGDGTVTLGVRNRLEAGETVEIIGRGMESHFLRLPEMSMTAADSGTTAVVTVAHPNSRVSLKLPFPAERYDLVRRVKAEADAASTPVSTRTDRS
jgi:putative protease